MKKKEHILEQKLEIVIMKLKLMVENIVDIFVDQMMKKLFGELNIIFLGQM